MLETGVYGAVHRAGAGAGDSEALVVANPGSWARILVLRDIRGDKTLLAKFQVAYRVGSIQPQTSSEVLT